MKVLEKANTSIVILSATERNVNLSSQDVAQVIRDPTAAAIQQDPGGQLAGVQLTSLRDQVVVTIAGGKLQFEDKSDEMPVTGKLPNIVDGFLTLLRNQGVEKLRAYGFNFDVAFDAPGDQAASEVLAERYIDKEALLRKGQLDVRGAGMRLYFPHGDAQCDMKIEPRGGQVDSPRFFAHINYHFELAEMTMPPVDELRTKYQGLWPHFMDLLEALVVRP